MQILLRALLPGQLPMRRCAELHCVPQKYIETPGVGHCVRAAHLVRGHAQEKLAHGYLHFPARARTRNFLHGDGAVGHLSRRRPGLNFMQQQGVYLRILM